MTGTLEILKLKEKLGKSLINSKKIKIIPYDLNEVSESLIMQLYLCVYKCSCKQHYGTIVLTTLWYNCTYNMTFYYTVFKIGQKLYTASQSAWEPIHQDFCA
jgi:hypothetical protein